MNSRVKGIVAIALASLWLVCTGTVYAQDSALSSIDLQFNFSTPGARSLSLGGAFVGLADDATAAVTNPAGLTVLSKPEVSIEGRSWDFTHVFTDRGHAFGDLRDIGVDDISGLRDGNASSSAEDLSFASFVYPGRRWAVAVYTHKLATFDAVLSSQGAFFDADDENGMPGLFRFLPLVARQDLDIRSFGVAGSYTVGDSLSIGIGVSYDDFSIDADVVRFSIMGDDITGPGGPFGPPDFSEQNQQNRQIQTGDDHDTTGTFGFLWRVNERWQLGGVFRQGPRFNFTIVPQVGPSLGGKLNVPDVYGLGVAYSPSQATTITLDLVSVEYSVLADDLVDIFAGPMPSAEEMAALAKLAVDDGEEFHVGFEYVFFNMKYPVAVRAGGWFDPDHRIRFVGEARNNRFERGNAVLFRGGDDEIHYSLGLGLVFGEGFEINAGVDLSDLVDTASLSAVLRF